MYVSEMSYSKSLEVMIGWCSLGEKRTVVVYSSSKYIKKKKIQMIFVKKATW